LKQAIIATLYNDESFKSSNSWLGLNSPVSEISNSGLWNGHGLKGQPLSDEELERVKWLVRFGNDRLRDNAESMAGMQSKQENDSSDEKSHSLVRITADDIRQYIDKLLLEAKMRGEEYLDLISGDIHRQLGLKNRMPDICRIMYEKMNTGDQVLKTTPSGMSSTIKIRYYLG
jgi:hypothetical protein